MSYVRLSYDLSSTDPGWPGNFTMSLETVSAISRGDVANQTKLTLLNHFGSHMDGPNHFNDNGPRLAEMPLDTFVGESPLLLHIPKSYNELVRIEDLAPYERQLQTSDLLLIRSGFSSVRKSDPDRYASEGPGVSSQACKYLIERFPNLKAIALDWISLASFRYLDDGILAHQYLLGMFHGRYICIIEDLNFESVAHRRIRRVVALPLFLKEADSAPVSVIAECEE